MNDLNAPPSTSRWQRTLLRSVALALLCGLLQAVLPSYTLGTVSLPPLSIVLGVIATAGR